jgi:hypothetical protein
MKAMAWIRNKFTEAPLSTHLFWIGLFVAALTVISPDSPGTHLVISILAVAVLVLAGWQKVIGDREQDQKFNQEHKAREAAEQYVYDHTPEGKERRARERLLTYMYKNSQEPHS